MKTAHWGILAFLGFSILWMGAAIWYWDRDEVRPAVVSKPAPATERSSPHASEPPSAASGQVALDAPAAADPAYLRAQSLARRLAQLIDRGEGDDELAAIERELLALGERAGAPLVALLRSERNVGRHDQLLDFLRRIPGAATDAYFIEQAGPAARRTARTIAMDELASRRSDAALDALNRVATTDPDVPSRPFLAEPRLPDDDSVELPDAVFTPRMKALEALASTEDPRVTSMLSSVLLNERDESLRMEAARHMQKLRADPPAVDALLKALGDPSAYVRLAVLHSLDGCTDPRLPALLSDLSQRDRDLGVRALALTLLARLSATKP
ncbi:MAG TPA: HEAT repeat domain-containing protein [Polyangiaceae bacterium]|nr:HEAT repeat domain-containing protein [Polyangiaceae bacterium]